MKLKVYIPVEDVEDLIMEYMAEKFPGATNIVYEKVDHVEVSYECFGERK